MGKDSKKKKSVLAASLEGIGRVRSRFRKSQPWLRFPVDDEDEELIVQSTKSVGYNHESLTAYYTAFGLKTIGVKTVEREASILSKTFSIHAWC